MSDVSTDQFDFARAINLHAGGLSKKEIKRGILMALISLDMNGELIDVDDFAIRCVTPVKAEVSDE